MRMTLAMLLKKIELGNQKLQNLISNEANVATYLTTPDAEITVPDYDITECYNEHLELTTAIVAAKAIIAEHNAEIKRFMLMARPFFTGHCMKQSLVLRNPFCQVAQCICLLESDNIRCQWR